MKKSLYVLSFVLVAFLLSSCSSVRVPPTVHPPSGPQVMIPPPGPMIRHDVFHSVGPGETLWRISKMYDVDVKDVMRANDLQTAEGLKMGQRLLVPQAGPIRPVVTLYPSNKWKYIIVHHSATEAGNALDFYKFHRAKGWDNLGYHFVIDNGTGGKKDGQIEVSPRWTKQQDGAHCKASGMNTRGIGICLVGDFSSERVSQDQLDSLVYLVNMLRKEYKIPLKNILGHGKVPEASTACPGDKFPWQEFLRRIESENK